MTRERPPRDAYQQALGLLVRREHSQREIDRKLAARGVEADERAAAVERLAAQGYQDQGRFAEMLVRSRAGAGYGPAYIRAELGTHRIADDVAARAFDELAIDWNDVARRALGRRFDAHDLAQPDRRRKAQALLIRRGFDADTIRAALSGGED